MPNLIIAGYGCFGYCDSLITLNLPKLSNAGPYCFWNNLSLVNVLLPEVISLGTQSFAYCPVLSEINLPSTIQIGDGCFFVNSSLTSITIPSCISLGSTVGNNNVFDVIFENTITLTIPSFLMTCNSGNPDGDIEYLQLNNTVTIIQI